MGTGGFAVPSFQRLIEAKHEIHALVTMPLKYTNGKKPIITPMRAVAMEYDIPIYDPPNINTQESADLLYLLGAEVLFVCDYGRILSNQILKTTPNRGLNLHGSLLPKYRGAAPVNRAILNGDEYTGVSMIHMIPEVDAGPVVAKSPPIPILDHETAEEVEHKLAVVGSWLVMQTIEQLETGRLPAFPQNLREGVTKAPKLRKEEGVIDWNQDARSIFNHVRAMTPWPKSTTTWNRRLGESVKALNLILNEVEVLRELPEEVEEGITKNAVPGTVVKAQGNQLIIAAARQWIRVLRIQPAGKAAMDAAGFINGYRIQQGERLG